MATKNNDVFEGLDSLKLQSNGDAWDAITEPQPLTEFFADVFGIAKNKVKQKVVFQINKSKSSDNACLFFALKSDKDEVYSIPGGKSIIGKSGDEIEIVAFGTEDEPTFVAFVSGNGKLEFNGEW